MSFHITSLEESELFLRQRAENKDCLFALSALRALELVPYPQGTSVMSHIDATGQAFPCPICCSKSVFFFFFKCIFIQIFIFPSLLKLKVIQN